MQKIEGPRIPIIFTQEQIERLDRIASRHKLTRSEAMRRILDLGIDVYEDFEAFGIPQLAEATKQIRKWIRARRQPRLV